MMSLKNRAPQSCRTDRAVVAILGALCGILAATGCGSGVSNLLPAVAPPSSTSDVLSGPILGYIFSPADGTLRAMLGVRGSARVSASIVPSGVYVSGDASAVSSAALLEDENGSLFSFNLPASQPLRVADGLPAGASIVFAPSGHSAVVYAPGVSGISLISGIPASPKVQKMSLSGSIRLVSAAVSDAGTIVIASQGSVTQIGTLSPGGQFSRIASVTSTPSLSFLAESDDMLLADGVANTLALVRNVSSSPSLQALDIAGLNHPVAVSGSSDRHWAAIANGSDANVLRVDLKTGMPVSKLSCACQPSQMSSLAGGAVFRITPLGTGPVWTVDLAGTTPQLLFVPAIGQTTP